MHEVKVNFVSKTIPAKTKRTVFFVGRAFAFLVAFTAIGASAMSFKIARSLPPGASVLDDIPVVSQIRSFIFAEDRADGAADDGRTNLLFLGVGGPGHDGPQLSDTMFLATLDTEGKRAGIISIPRDLLVDIPEKGERKINAANAYGEEKGFGEGPKLSSQVVENVFGTKIDYYLRVDFSAFESIVNQIGGIDVYVDRGFTDEQYPTSDLGYETITFNSGMQHMDGATALKYARSRHGNNGEGSDFARSGRQQKVIYAVKQKVLSSSTLLSPITIAGIIKTLRTHMVTNMSVLDMISVFQQYKGIEQKNIVTKVLIPGDAETLYETYVNGAYVLLPKNPDWSELRALPTTIFDAPSATTEVSAIPAHVEVQNGTVVSGLARETAGKIAKNGFVVAKICNAAVRDVEKTIILDLTKGKRPADLNRLKKILGAESQVPSNGWSYTTEITPTDGVQVAGTSVQPKDLDFLVILGSGAQVSSR